MDHYEVQIYNSHDYDLYYEGQSGSIYKQSAPYVNVCKAPGQWQTLDVLFTRPILRIDNDKVAEVIRPARITVIQNGVVVQNNYEIEGDTFYDQVASYQPHRDREPIQLQMHSNRVSYRNIWVREIPDTNKKIRPHVRPYFAAPGTKAPTADIIITKEDNSVEKKTVPILRDGHRWQVRLKAENCGEGIKWISVIPSFSSAKAGEEGFFIMANGMLGHFKKVDKDAEYVFRGNIQMPIFGEKTPRKTYLGLVEGMKYDFNMVAGVKKDDYYFYPRFNLNGNRPYEDIVVNYYYLNDPKAGYPEMAKIYRDYQLSKGICRPLKDRVKDSPELKYAVDSVEVRIRQGWKPSPGPLEVQTPETEPPMKVAVTFDRVGQLLDEFKKQGIPQAEICLVGWNIGGHDGRFPQHFPVEPKLGGEVALRNLIKKAQGMGFQIVAHTCPTDAYQIANNWSDEYIIKNKDGSMMKGPSYGGGRMHSVCPLRIFDVCIKDDFPKLVEMGFKGLFYLDVLSIVNPRTCYDPRHPSTSTQSAKEIVRVMDYVKKSFGGVQSEGAIDAYASVLDYALYVSFDTRSKYPPFIERVVPFWQLVYHGIIMSNPFAETANFTIKEPAAALRMIEFGGRPMFYFHSMFKSNQSDWMGKVDLSCETDAIMRKSVEAVKRGVDEYNEMSYLQYLFMTDHCPLAKDVWKTVYSDGSYTVTNYSDRDYQVDSQTVKAKNYRLFKAGK